MHLSENIWPQPSSVEATRQALAYRAHHVDRNAALHELLIEALLERRRVDLDAGQSRRESRRRQAACPRRDGDRYGWGSIRLIADQQLRGAA